ncbi:MAG: hypothetical protein AAF585_09700, partial [Verrucomicrobiota bacterium]
NASNPPAAPSEARAGRGRADTHRRRGRRFGPSGAAGEQGRLEHLDGNTRDLRSGSASRAGRPPGGGRLARRRALSKHEITLYVVSVTHKPGPSVRKLVEQTEGDWKLVSVK